MGMHTAEIVPAVNHGFGFSMPEKDAALPGTAVEPPEYFPARRFRGYREDHLTAIASHKLALAITSVLKIPVGAVRESTRLEEIVPAHRRRIWRALRRESGLRLPGLRRPAWATRLAAAATVASGIAAPAALSLRLFGGAIIAALLAMLAAGNLFAWLTRPLARRFHSDCETMGQLASLTMAMNYQRILDEFRASAS
ncbi:MAG: hypothetical protein JW959_11935 [Pirellulales bacterium]|nr:hypothetical protein [Pirellulales bacterium]